MKKRVLIYIIIITISLLNSCRESQTKEAKKVLNIINNSIAYISNQNPEQTVMENGKILYMVKANGISKSWLGSKDDSSPKEAIITFSDYKDKNSNYILKGKIVQKVDKNNTDINGEIIIKGNKSCKVLLNYIENANTKIEGIISLNGVDYNASIMN